MRGRKGVSGNQEQKRQRRKIEIQIQHKQLLCSYIGVVIIIITFGYRSMCTTANN